MYMEKDELKQEIIEAINRVESKAILKYLHKIITSYLKNRGV